MAKPFETIILSGQAAKLRYGCAALFRAQCYKTFLSAIYKFSYKASAFVRLGQKSLPGTSTDLLQKFVNYQTKTLYSIRPQQSFH
jgi:hypothetical protein